MTRDVINNVVTLPDGYTKGVPRLQVVDRSTKQPLQYEDNSDGTLTVLSDHGATVYVGGKYTSVYQPARPYREDSDGQKILDDRLRIARFVLDLVKTNELIMRIFSDYVDIPEQVFNARYLYGTQQILDASPLYSGTTKFAYAQNADLARAVFFCENHLPCTIVGIGWEGQYHQSTRRM